MEDANDFQLIHALQAKADHSDLNGYAQQENEVVAGKPWNLDDFRQRQRCEDPDREETTENLVPSERPEEPPGIQSRQASGLGVLHLHCNRTYRRKVPSALAVRSCVTLPLVGAGTVL